MKKIISVGVVIVLSGSLFISCKKDDNTSSNTSYGFLPAAGTYTYHNTSTDGTPPADETVVVSGRRDSAGGHAVTMASAVLSYHSQAVLFADAVNTIEPIYPPKEFDSLANAIRAMGIPDFTYEGWPVYQKMPNTAVLNDALSFSGGPVHMHWTTTAGPMDYTLAYLNGKVVQTGQKITTPAGTFTCSVWTYGMRSTTITPIGQFILNFSDTLWMSPGLPFVKSSEQSSTAYSVTVLTKIN